MKIGKTQKWSKRINVKTVKIKTNVKTDKMQKCEEVKTQKCKVVKTQKVKVVKTQKF